MSGYQVIKYKSKPSITAVENDQLLANEVRDFSWLKIKFNGTCSFPLKQPQRSKHEMASREFLLGSDDSRKSKYVHPVPQDVRQRQHRLIYSPDVETFRLI